MRTQRTQWGIRLYLMLYAALNLLFLTRFPMMHSDESWLSGLARAMLENGLNTKEPFFDLYPAYPNAVGIVFQLIQMAFLRVLGYRLLSVRLISLLFGCAALAVFYRLLRRATGSNAKSFSFTIVLSFDIQFLTASHLARQDIIVAFGVLSVLCLLTEQAERPGFRRDAAAGVLLGLLAGVHPNFVMALGCACALYLYYLLTGVLRVPNFLVMLGVTACFCAAYAGASLLMDGDFFSHYFSYGGSLGVGNSLAGKLSSLPGYFLKLFYGVSGTYNLPPVGPQLLLFGAAGAACALLGLRRRSLLRPLLPVLSVLGVLVLLGRYSQPAVVILFPLCYLTVFALLDRLPGKAPAAAALALAAALLFQSAWVVRPYLNDDYEDYLSAIRVRVPPDSRVLANLNCEYAFDSGALLDYRNLAFLGEQSFEAYVRERRIEYIIYPEEMDYIYDARPVWNLLYGNLFPYYRDMQTFLTTSCTLADVFSSPYAMRISGYSYAEPWEVRIYRVKEAAS